MACSLATGHAWYVIDPDAVVKTFVIQNETNRGFIRKLASPCTHRYVHNYEVHIAQGASLTEFCFFFTCTARPCWLRKPGRSQEDRTGAGLVSSQAVEISGAVMATSRLQHKRTRKTAQVLSLRGPVASRMLRRKLQTTPANVLLDCVVFAQRLPA